MAIIPLDALKNIRFELGRITLKEIDLQDCPRIAEIALAVARKATRDIQAAGHPLPLLEMHGLGHLYDWKHVSDDWLFCPYANLGQPFDTAARRYYERAAKARTLSPRDIVRLVIAFDDVVAGVFGFIIRPCLVDDSPCIGYFGQAIDPQFQGMHISSRVQHASYYFIFSILLKMPIYIDWGYSKKISLIATCHPLNNRSKIILNEFLYKKFNSLYLNEYAQYRDYYSCSMEDALKWYERHMTCAYTHIVRGDSITISTRPKRSLPDAGHEPLS